MGIAQLMRTGIVDFMHIPVPGNFDLAGIIYWVLNIPLFYMGLRIMGKDFAVKNTAYSNNSECISCPCSNSGDTNYRRYP